MHDRNKNKERNANLKSKTSISNQNQQQKPPIPSKNRFLNKRDYSFVSNNEDLIIVDPTVSKVTNLS